MHKSIKLIEQAIVLWIHSEALLVKTCASIDSIALLGIEFAQIREALLRKHSCSPDIIFTSYSYISLIYFFIIFYLFAILFSIILHPVVRVEFFDNSSSSNNIIWFNYAIIDILLVRSSKLKWTVQNVTRFETLICDLWTSRLSLAPLLVVLRISAFIL